MATVEQQLTDLEAILGDKYDVLRRIGGGGMSQVFLVRHKFHGGLFAVKVLAEHLAQDPRIVARFEQEARTAASLSGHPNIVPIFDVGEGNGLYYLIMQYVAGEDLGSYLRREGKLQPATAANVIAQTAEGLAWSESKRVVHRDLKPGNILLDLTGRMMLLDFGISKITDISDGLTRPGESLGTPYYMSPEQIRGEGCDVRSDLYSLGVVFFELLTGSRPFENESCAAIQIAHLSVPPPSVLTLDPSLPAACDLIIQKLMQKDRENRYQSPRDLLDELLALGATSGPSSLRPVIDPNLAAELAQTSPTTARHIDPANAATAYKAPSRTPIPMTASPRTPTPVPAIESSPAPEKAPLKAKSKRGLIVGSALALVVIAAVLSFLIVSAKPKAVLADSHGTMLLVPTGPFVFGNSDPDSPNPQQSVTLEGFYIDETEVSNAEYKRFCDATGHIPPVSSDFNSNPGYPVAGISLEDAKAFATWAGKRLPTEQEWEKAARGTDGRTYPWGSEPWTNGIPTQLQPVNSLDSRKSPFGALNMAGNVFEWTSTIFPAGEREYSNMQSVLGTSSFSRAWYTIKGGSFAAHGETFFRLYMRRGFPSDQHSPWIGFRCVREIPRQGFIARLQGMWSK
jgi:eukaryotic-like serine/threonine-protein kinase